MTSKSNEIRYDSVESAGVTINYSWCHSRRRTLGIRVLPDKSVSVRVPMRTSLKETRNFVSSRAGWVLKVWKNLDTRPTPQSQDYGRGAVFMYQGEALRLEFASAPHVSIHLHEGLLMLVAPELPSEETVRRTIDAWYRKQAQHIVSIRSTECHRMMQEENIPLPPITIRPMKTRWGSYSYRTKRIAINLNLIKMPLACLDYVIIHELCHIKIRHHGANFWHLVGRYVPDYLTLRRLLNHYNDHISQLI